MKDYDIIGSLTDETVSFREAVSLSGVGESKTFKEITRPHEATDDIAVVVGPESEDSADFNHFIYLLFTHKFRRGFFFLPLFFICDIIFVPRGAGARPAPLGSEVKLCYFIRASIN